MFSQNNVYFEASRPVLEKNASYTGNIRHTVTLALVG